LDYDAEQIYLDRQLIEQKKISLKEMQDKIADFMIEFEGVDTRFKKDFNKATALKILKYPEVNLILANSSGNN